MFLASMAPPPEGKGGPGGLFISMAPLLFIVVIFYFLLIMPQQKKAKKHQEMLKQLKKGDEVVTASGIHAKVAMVTDDLIHLEVADRTVLRFNKDQISTVKEKRADKKPEGKPSVTPDKK